MLSNPRNGCDLTPSLLWSKDTTLYDETNGNDPTDCEQLLRCDLCQRLRSGQPTGGLTPVVYLFGRRVRKLRARWLCVAHGTRRKTRRNTGDTRVYTGSGLRRVKLYVQLLVLYCSMRAPDVDLSRHVLGRTSLAALYSLADKVGGPRVQVGYNLEPISSQLQ